MRHTASAATATFEGEELDKAIDAVAAILRAIGSIEVEPDGDARASSERWARHVLLLTPAGPSHQGGRRDWGGVVRFVADMRQRERKALTTTTDALRQAIWGFAEGLKAAVGDDALGADDMHGLLARLRDAATNGSGEALREETLAVTASMTTILAERKKAQDATLRDLGVRLKKISAELEEVRSEAAHDGLTRVFNRRAFDGFIERVATLDALVGRSAALLMIDIDRFKAINDTWGHPAGDEVLRRLGDCLTRAFPRRTDLVARYGGEEFAVVLRDTSPTDARSLAKRLLEAIRAVSVKFGGRTFGFTASIGVAVLAPRDTPATWIQRADRALYQAKQSGRDRFVEGVP